MAPSVIFHLLLHVSSIVLLETGLAYGWMDDISLATNSCCQRACAELATQFGPALRYPTADNFTIWDSKQQEVRPACRVEPSDSADVAKIMTILVNNWCEFAVKSGGHSRSRGSSNSDGGVTIDLGRISAVELSADGEVAKVGSGATWAPVYFTLEDKNLAVIGGRNGDVGVGGLILGGGISFLSPKYGWAADNVVEFEVVLPNATVVTASEYEHPDLYFALRGGGNNFGIVTYFLCKTVRQGKMWGGSKTYSVDDTDEVLEAAHQLTTTDSNDTNVAFWNALVWIQGKDMILNVVEQIYADPVVDPPAFDPLKRIPELSSTMSITYMSNITLEVQKGSPSGFRNTYSTLTFFPSKHLQKRIIDIFKEEVGAVKEVEEIVPSIVFQPVYMNALEAMKKRGGNPMGLDVSGPMTIMLISVGWKDADSDKAVYGFVRRYMDRSRDAAAELGFLHPYIYQNYASADQDVFKGYGEGSMERAKAIQKSVDPMGVFTKDGLCRGYFKLS